MITISTLVLSLTLCALWLPPSASKWFQILTGSVTLAATGLILFSLFPVADLLAENPLPVCLALIIAPTMAPIGSLVTLLGCVTLASAQLASFGYYWLAEWENPTTQSALSWRIFASNVILVIISLISGQYRRVLSSRFIRGTFNGARGVIEARIKLEFEREQQEQLLLSVIPAYIAAEVKRRILVKMTDTCSEPAPRRTGSKQRFHELYVQRHNNVR